VSVYQNVVFLHEDFEVGPGPAFHVYLVPAANIRDAGQVTGTMFIDSAACARSRQPEISIPSGADLSQFPSVVIWCQQILGADLARRPDFREEFLSRLLPRLTSLAQSREGSWPNS
jgi:hypothetical protein